MNENEYNQMINEANIYKQQLDIIQSELAQATKTLSEIDMSKTTLKKTGQKEDMILPIGGGVFLNGVVDIKRVLLRVGGGYSIVISREKAIEELEKREQAITKLVDKFNKEAMNLTDKLNMINIRLSQLQNQTLGNKNQMQNKK